jgi:hypothetical protein
MDYSKPFLYLLGTLAYYYVATIPVVISKIRITTQRLNLHSPSQVFLAIGLILFIISFVNFELVIKKDLKTGASLGSELKTV